MEDQGKRKVWVVAAFLGLQGATARQRGEADLPRISVSIVLPYHPPEETEHSQGLTFSRFDIKSSSGNIETYNHELAIFHNFTSWRTSQVASHRDRLRVGTP